MSEHYGVEKILDAEAHLLPPEEAKKIIEHVDGCDDCFGKWLRYLEKHYQEAKEWLAGGYLDDLAAEVKERKTDTGYSKLPDSLRKRIDEITPPVHEKVANLRDVLLQLEVLDQKQGDKLKQASEILAGYEQWPPPESSTKQDFPRLFSLFADAMKGYQAICQSPGNECRRMLREAKRDAHFLTHFLFDPWQSWRTVAACLPYSMDRIANLANEKAYLLNFELAAILFGIIVQRLTEPWPTAKLPKPFEDLRMDVKPMFPFCATAIAKCTDLEYAPHIKDMLEESFRAMGIECKLVTVRGESLRFSTSQASEPPWLSSLKDYKRVMPEIVGQVVAQERELRVMVEVKQYVKPLDVVIAEAVAKKWQIDRAILVSRIPLFRVRRDIPEMPGPHVFVIEWDEVMDAFTDFYPTNSLEGIIS